MKLTLINNEVYVYDENNSLNRVFRELIDGEKSIKDISLITGINRSCVHDILQRLIYHNIIEKIENPNNHKIGRHSPTKTSKSNGRGVSLITYKIK